MKVDITKAYDTVNWSFLTELLIALKFPQPVVQWIQTCVQTVTFSLVLNGEPTSSIVG